MKMDMARNLAETLVKNNLPSIEEEYDMRKNGKRYVMSLRVWDDA
jgi:hypothetical protein